MFFSISSLWNTISSFARNLRVPEDRIMKAKQDFKKLHAQYRETQRRVREKYESKWDESLSIQKFFPWWANLLCFFELELSGFRHAALRELRSYLEDCMRSYYIDSRYPEKSYEDKTNILRLFKPKKTEKDTELLKTILGKKREREISMRITFKELLQGMPRKKRNELEKLYSDLCEYVHLSESAQTDALGDFGLNLALNLPCYEEDLEMLEKTFEYCCYLLLESLEEKEFATRARFSQ